MRHYFTKMLNIVTQYDIMRTEEFRARLSPLEKEILTQFFKRGKKQGKWKTHREMLFVLKEEYDGHHLEGKFLTN